MVEGWTSLISAHFLIEHTTEDYFSNLSLYPPPLAVLRIIFCKRKEADHDVVANGAYPLEGFTSPCIKYVSYGLGILQRAWAFSLAPYQDICSYA